MFIGASITTQASSFGAVAFDGHSDHQSGQRSMRNFMRHWNYVEGPARLLQYDDLLYPQYDHKFTAISRDTWEYVQDKAKEKLAATDGQVHPNVAAHWRSIAGGEVPFL